MTATSASSESAPRRQTVADVLGLGSIADSNETISADAVLALYRYARGEFGNRELITHSSTFSRGWIDLDAGAAKEYLDPFYASDGGEGRQMKRVAQANLQAVAWNDLLGINDPPIRVQVKIHGSKWGLRFIAVEVAMKGRERINEELPTAAAGEPGTASANAPAGVQPATFSGSSTTDPSAPPPPGTLPEDFLDQILREAGMPS